MRSSLKYWGFSILSGLLLSLSWPARGIPFIILFALVPLLYVEDQLSKSRYKGWKFFGYSYVAFFIWNLLTTYWIYFSSPEGAYTAIVANSFFMAAVWWFFHRTKNVLGERRGYVGLVVYWIAYEFLHLDWDLSWPWLMMGNSFANYVQFIQWYEITGAMGGTLWILVSNILLFRLVKAIMEQKVPVKKYYFIAGCWVIIPMMISAARYYTYQEGSATNKAVGLNIVLVQPNIDPWKKFDVITPEQQMDRILSLAGSLTDSTTDYVICPETAIPVGVWDHKLDSNRQILTVKEFIAPYPHLKFITGIVHLQLYGPGEKIPSTAEPYRGGMYFDDHNPAIQIDNTQPYQLYHKSKLVPGPEMFPFAEVLKPMQNKLFGDLGGQIGDMGTQKECTVFYNDYRHVSAAPVICYESIYGEFVGEYMLNGGSFISVSTNDAWWGDSPGYKQLLAYTRIRAIETRRSVARSANTGISCFINQRGDIEQPTAFGETTAIKGRITANGKITYYTRYGDYIGRAGLLLAGMLLVYALVRGVLRKRKAV